MAVDSYGADGPSYNSPIVGYLIHESGSHRLLSKWTDNTLVSVTQCLTEGVLINKHVQIYCAFTVISFFNPYMLTKTPFIMYRVTY